MQGSTTSLGPSGPLEVSVKPILNTLLVGWMAALRYHEYHRAHSDSMLDLQSSREN